MASAPQIPPPAMPPLGQPDRRTQDQKARRVQYLARCITNANDLDIAYAIFDALPLVLFTFNLMVRSNALHGYVHLLLRGTWRLTSNPAFMGDLGRRIPELHKALKGTKVDAKARDKALQEILDHRNPSHELAVRQTLFRALHIKDEPWANDICSGCLQCKRQGAMVGKHQFCHECFPIWCASTGQYYSQKQVDQWWLGVGRGLVPGFEFQHWYSGIPKLRQYHARTVEQLAQEIHGMSLDALKEKTQNTTPADRLTFAKKLCRYSARRICFPHHLAPWDLIRQGVMESIGRFYGHRADVLSFGSLSDRQFMNRIADIEIANPVVQRLTGLANGKEKPRMKSATPSFIRGIVAERGNHPSDKAGRLVLDELTRRDSGSILSLGQIRIKKVISECMDRDCAQHNVPTLATILLPDENFAPAVFWEYMDLVRALNDDWHLWLQFVDTLTHGPNLVNWNDIANRVDDIWSRRSLYTADEMLSLILHVSASSICHSRLGSPEFIQRALNISTQYRLCYRPPPDNTPPSILDSWMRYFGGPYVSWISQGPVNMPYQGLKWVIADKIFVYERYLGMQDHMAL